jgi:hypothetical protein
MRFLYLHNSNLYVNTDKISFVHIRNTLENGERKTNATIYTDTVYSSRWQQITNEEDMQTLFDFLDANKQV